MIKPTKPAKDHPIAPPIRSLRNFQPDWERIDAALQNLDADPADSRGRARTGGGPDRSGGEGVRP